jgi:2-oxo-4-hydroxy-4-carboxy--5-ureidoimidazoline (OHCU) decarboxylase
VRGTKEVDRFESANEPNYKELNEKYNKEGNSPFAVMVESKTEKRGMSEEKFLANSEIIVKKEKEGK